MVSEAESSLKVLNNEVLLADVDVYDDDVDNKHWRYTHNHTYTITHILTHTNLPRRANI